MRKHPKVSHNIRRTNTNCKGLKDELYSILINLRLKLPYLKVQKPKKV